MPLNVEMILHDPNLLKILLILRKLPERTITYFFFLICLFLIFNIYHLPSIVIGSVFWFVYDLFPFPVNLMLSFATSVSAFFTFGDYKSSKELIISLRRDGFINNLKNNLNLEKSPDFYKKFFDEQIKLIQDIKYWEKQFKRFNIIMVLSGILATFNFFIGY